MDLVRRVRWVNVGKLAVLPAVLALAATLGKSGVPVVPSGTAVPVAVPRTTPALPPAQKPVAVHKPRPSRHRRHHHEKAKTKPKKHKPPVVPHRTYTPPPPAAQAPEFGLS